MEVIFTNHSLNRLKDRHIDQQDIISVIQHSDRVVRLEKSKKKFIKQINDRNIQVVATYIKPEKKWLVVSVWVRGEEDRAPLVWQILVSLAQVIKFVLSSVYRVIFKRKF